VLVGVEHDDAVGQDVGRVLAAEQVRALHRG
jgi:hypothetical protein